MVEFHCQRHYAKYKQTPPLFSCTQGQMYILDCFLLLENAVAQLAHLQRNTAVSHHFVLHQITHLAGDLADDKH